LAPGIEKKDRMVLVPSLILRMVIEDGKADQTLCCFLVAKTRTQLNRRLAEGKKLPWPPFGRAWYAGCTTLVIGNSLKAGIRTSPPILASPACNGRISVGSLTRCFIC
jgi:hypothetical protein